MTRIPVVNEEDEIIGYKERDEVTNADIDRVAALWITNAAGKVLMAQRAAAKRIDPLRWGPAVAGTVEEGETYEANIVKEAREEIGLELSAEELVLGPKMRVTNDKRNYFAQWFLHTTERPIESFIIEPAEVAQIAWFDPDELKNDVNDNPDKFTPSAQAWSEHLL